MKRPYKWMPSLVIRIMPWNPQQMAINEMKKRIYDL